MGWLPRVACFARNPGLGNRNTYSVAVGGCLGLLFIKKPQRLGLGAAVGEGDSGGIAPGYVSGSLLAHDKLEGATCHDVGVGDVVLLILLAVEQSGCVVIHGVRWVGRSGCVVIRGV